MGVYIKTAEGLYPAATVQGPEGPAGATGPTGPQGPQGAPGADGAGTVESVNGDPGPDVVLDATDVGLGNVDNTSDTNKPVSSATQTALNLKAPLAAPALTGAATLDGQALVKSDDSRLTDARTPSGPADGSLTGNYPNPTIANLAITDAMIAAANKDGAVGVPSLRTLGTGALQAAAGNHGHVITPKEATDDATTYPVGLSTFETGSTTTWPTAFGSIYTAYLNGNRGQQQFLDKATGRMWTRTADTVGTNGWTAWRELVVTTDTRLTDARTPTAHNHSAVDLNAGTVPDARLPGRLGVYPVGPPSGNWNNAVETGWYMGSSTTNSPTGGAEWWMGDVVAHNSLWVTQTLHAFTDDWSATDSKTYRRSSSDNAGVRTWGSWFRIRQFEGELDDRYARSTGGGREKYQDKGTANGTVTCDLSVASTFYISNNGNVTLAFSNVPPDLTACTVTVTFYPSGNGYTITPPAGSRIMGAALPTSTAFKMITLTLYTHNAGSWWIVSAVKEI